MSRLRNKAKSKAVALEPSNDWQAESDMRVLADAEKIRANKGRLKKAQFAASREVSKLGKILK